MDYTSLMSEIVGTYQKHSWKLHRVLLRSETRGALGDYVLSLGSVPIEESSIDALWFSRPSHNDRDAWELRLLAETQYALFETFEADETEEQREELRHEMEALLRDVLRGPNGNL